MQHTVESQKTIEIITSKSEFDITQKQDVGRFFFEVAAMVQKIIENRKSLRRYLKIRRTRQESIRKSKPTAQYNRLFLII